MPNKGIQDIEDDIQKLNDIYFVYSRSLTYLENKQALIISNLEKEIVEDELKKIRNTIE